MRRLIALVSAFSTLIVGCQTLPSGPDAVGTSGPPTGAWQLPIGARRFTVDPDRSEIRVLLYRGGSLAELGHNHVIGGSLQGDVYVGTNAESSGFRLCLFSASLEVDNQSKRAEEGVAFAESVPQAARIATRNNMLGDRVLAADAFPVVEMLSDSLTGPLWNPDVEATVKIAGRRGTVQFPAAVFQRGKTLLVVGRLHIRQSSLGIEPYSVLGGNLQVVDDIGVRIKLAAVQNETARATACNRKAAGSMR